MLSLFSAIHDTIKKTYINKISKLTGSTPAQTNRSPLPLHPPRSLTPLKRKLSLETPAENCFPLPSLCDSGVQVILCMRPLKKDEYDDGSQIVQKISANSISIFDHTFTFDSVADTDIFQLVGVLLVENCLAGFNSSIFAFGQPRSGKTYTTSGPSSSLTADNSSNQERGLTSRVFEMLFSRIHEVAYNFCLILKSFDALVELTQILDINRQTKYIAFHF
ncbi:Kinesin-like protein KIN12B [Platanthera zijinensis]|uniref:Kinesin-like protein KIN12B n=1 Tax=Platanthera zijinensis TaxID=2320716 RepID=A0AAP0C597_9ASPA